MEDSQDKEAYNDTQKQNYRYFLEYTKLKTANDLLSCQLKALNKEHQELKVTISRLEKKMAKRKDIKDNIIDDVYLQRKVLFFYSRE